MRVLGIDPGFERIGLAVLEKERGGRETFVYSECFKTKPTLPFHDRLLLIGEKIKNVVSEFRPDLVAVEKLYFEKNLKTAMGVSEARGTIIYSAKSSGADVREYTPLEVKVAVTGYGKADKKQVDLMAQKLVMLPKKISSDDEMDAIAIAITCLAIERG